MRQVAPDLLLHGGDLADTGSRPAEVLDLGRDQAWEGVAGNTDQMLFQPASLDEHRSTAPGLQRMFGYIEEMAEATRAKLGAARLAWLATLPDIQVHDEVALVHGSPASPWRAPGKEAADAEFEATYGELQGRLIVYGHIHQPFLKETARLRIANTGSAGLPYDGDPRAACLVIDGGHARIRRVEYDPGREIKALEQRRMPHSVWVASMLRTAQFQMPL